jgi:hypothetical protein
LLLTSSLGLQNNTIDITIIHNIMASFAGRDFWRTHFIELDAVPWNKFLPAFRSFFQVPRSAYCCVYVLWPCGCGCG